MEKTVTDDNSIKVETSRVAQYCRNNASRINKDTSFIPCNNCVRQFENSVSHSCHECLEEKPFEVMAVSALEESEVETAHETVETECCCNCHDNDLDPNPNKDISTNLEISCDTSRGIECISAVSPNKSMSGEQICRICLDNVDEGQLIAPCKCSGSTKYAHEQCLLKWFFKSSKKSCEVCLGQVNVTPIGYKPLQEWRLPNRGCDFIIYLFGLYFLIMIIFTGMITWIATQGCVSPVCVTLYAVCGVALLYFFYCCGCVEYSRQYWRALLSVNRVWRIYGRADSVNNLKDSIIQKPVENNFIVTVDSLKDSGNNIKPHIINVGNRVENNTLNNNHWQVHLGVDNPAFN